MPRSTDNIKITLNLKSQPSLKECDWPGCQHHGEFRAPRDRHHLTDYLWFCKPHIRLYNSQWDYFSGMTAQQIYDHQKRDQYWHRTTWKMGEGPAAGTAHIDDTHDILKSPLSPAQRHGHGQSPLDEKDLQALKYLNLDAAASLHDIKEAYKKLAKKYHPDTNGGKRKYESRFKKVSLAYQHLRMQKHKFC